MKTIDVKMAMPELTGYEYTGEYRQARKGEHCLYDEDPRLMTFNTDGLYPILRKARTWKPLTIQRAAELLQSQETVEWRYLNSETTLTASVSSMIFVGASGIQVNFRGGKWAYITEVQLLESQKGE